MVGSAARVSCSGWGDFGARGALGGDVGHVRVVNAFAVEEFGDGEDVTSARFRRRHGNGFCRRAKVSRLKKEPPRIIAMRFAQCDSWSVAESARLTVAVSNKHPRQILFVPEAVKGSFRGHVDNNRLGLMN